MAAATRKRPLMQLVKWNVKSRALGDARGILPESGDNMPMYMTMLTNIILVIGYEHDIPTGRQAISSLLGFLAGLVSAVGLVMFAVGLLKLTQSLSDLDGRSDQQAVFFFGTAIILACIRAILYAVGVDYWVLSLPNFPSIEPM